MLNYPGVREKDKRFHPWYRILAESSRCRWRGRPPANSERTEPMCLRVDAIKHRQSQIGPIWPFFRRQKPQTPDFLLENQGFVFVECGGEGEIRKYPHPRSLSRGPGIQGLQRCRLCESVPTPFPRTLDCTALRVRTTRVGS